MPKAKSKAQMRFFGAVAGGAIEKKGLSESKAREMLRGEHMKGKPDYIHEKKKKHEKRGK
jgi:hypothetical protein